MDTSGETVPEVSVQGGDPGEESTPTPDTGNSSIPEVLLPASESPDQSSQGDPAQN